MTIKTEILKRANYRADFDGVIAHADATVSATVNEFFNPFSATIADAFADVHDCAPAFGFFNKFHNDIAYATVYVPVSANH